MHVVDAPGSRVVVGQLTGPTFASVTPTDVSVTLPEFVTRKVYVIVEPAVIPLGVPAVLCSVIAGTLAMVVSVESVPVGGVIPDGGVAPAVAVFAT